jgi:hypothetical protein
MKLLCKNIRQGGIIRKRTLACKPALLQGHGPYLATLGPADDLRSGNLPVGLAHADSMNNLTVIVHLEPPVAHFAYPPACRCRKHTEVFVLSEMFFERYDKIICGSITAISNWPHYADHKVAPLR